MKWKQPQNSKHIVNNIGLLATRLPILGPGKLILPLSWFCYLNHWKGGQNLNKSLSVFIWYHIRRRQWQPTPVLLPGKSHERRSLVGCSPWGRKESDTTERLHFHALDKEMATHSSVLAWRISGTEKPGGLPSVGSHRVRHDWCNSAAAGA